MLEEILTSMIKIIEQNSTIYFLSKTNNIYQLIF